MCPKPGGGGCTEGGGVCLEVSIELHCVRELSTRNDSTATDQILERVTENKCRIRLVLGETDGGLGIKVELDFFPIRSSYLTK